MNYPMSGGPNSLVLYIRLAACCATFALLTCLASSPAYALSEIKQWLALFLRRFFANQFKRSALPNGPKMSSGGSLSPRGDWRAPSDANASVWLAELAANVPDQ